MGTIKDRNGMDLTEAEDIKNRWQEYTIQKKKAKIIVHMQQLFYRDIFSMTSVKLLLTCISFLE